MLYHVSIEEVEIGIFTPRIPSYKLENENKDINRICFSTSLEGAFSALPKNLILLNNYFKFAKKIKIKPIFYVYTIDEKYIQQENLITNYNLVKNNLVPDASMTSEVWVINQNVKCNCKIIYLEDFSISQENVYIENKSYYMYKISKLIYKEINKNNLFYKILDNFWNKFDNILNKYIEKDEFYDGYKRDMLLSNF